MSSKENPLNFTEAEMEESRRLANSPEMKEMMEKARAQSIIENEQKDKKFTREQGLLKQREVLRDQIIKINEELRDLGYIED